MMIPKRLICIAALASLTITVTAHAFDERRMTPAKRLFHDGFDASGRDSARGAVRRSGPMRGRGRSYDEVLSAAESMKPRRVKAGQRSRKKRASTRKVKTGVGQPVRQSRVIRKK